MKQWSSNAKDRPDLQTQISGLLHSADPMKFEKADTAAAMYLLNKIGYDETGAPEAIILAAAQAVHTIVGVFFNINEEVK